MLRNYFLINIVLLVMIGFLGLKFYEVNMHARDIPKEPAEGQVPGKTETVKGEDRPVDPSFFQIIPNMDLFRPSRSPYREEALKPAVPKIPPRLFGTIILGNERTAILEDPNTKLTRMYRVNEPVGVYVVSEIMEDRVVLTSDGERAEVRLREEKKGLPQLRQQVIPPPQPIPVPRQQQPVQRPAPQRPRPVPPAPPVQAPQPPSEGE